MRKACLCIVLGFHHHHHHHHHHRRRRRRRRPRRHHSSWTNRNPSESEVNKSSSASSLGGKIFSFSNRSTRYPQGKTHVGLLQPLRKTSFEPACPQKKSWLKNPQTVRTCRHGENPIIGPKEMYGIHSNPGNDWDKLRSSKRLGLASPPWTVHGFHKTTPFRLLSYDWWQKHLIFEQNLVERCVYSTPPTTKNQVARDLQKWPTKKDVTIPLRKINQIRFQQ